MSDEMVLAICVGGFLGFGLGMMLFALVMRPADEAGRKSDAERIRRLEGELQATSAKYREMANMMAYWRSRCIAYEKMLVERSRKAGAKNREAEEKRLDGKRIPELPAHTAGKWPAVLLQAHGKRGLRRDMQKLRMQVQKWIKIAARFVGRLLLCHGFVEAFLGGFVALYINLFVRPFLKLMDAT